VPDLTPSQNNSSQPGQSAEEPTSASELPPSPALASLPAFDRNGAGQRSEVAELRPRVHTRPHDVLDVLDRHLTSATESDAALGRYLTVVRMFRNTVALWIGIPCAIWVAGVLVAIRCGVPPWTAAGLGLGGPAVTTVVGWSGLRRRGRRGGQEMDSSTADVKTGTDP